MFENYKLVLPGTNIHLVTFAIIAFEVVILIYQLIFFLYRPSDKNRLWYVILLSLLVLYNVTGGLFPDPRLPVSITFQYISAYGAGILMSIYIPFYSYKFLGLEKLKFYAYYGSFYFLFLPFILTFVIPYLITRNIDLCSKLIVIVPSFYALSFLFSFLKSVILHTNEKTPMFQEKIIGILTALFFWIGGLTIVTILKGEQIVEHSITNFGFLIMTVIFVRSTIIDSRIEYQKLLQSERDLIEANKSLQLKVYERTKELELVNEQKMNIFINLAHEIKTPITLINNYLNEFLVKHGNNHEMKIIQSNIEKLNDDIVNCFNEERFLRGIQPDYNHDQVVNLSNFINDKLVLFFLYAKNKGIKLKDNIQWNLYVKADPGALDSIINNLIENAIKYTAAKGSVIVTLNSQSDSLYISVKDNGYGIPEELHEKIFKPYYQISRGNTSQPGLGLGLSIVNNIVKSLSGEIILKSKENEGTEFIVKLKQYHLLNNENVEDYKPKTPSKLSVFKTILDDIVDKNKRTSVLIVEDNKDMLLYLRNKLSESYNVYVAENGKKALLKLEAIPCPDLIISDVMMDEMDGFEFARAISENTVYKQIPLIFLTAKTTSADRMQGLSLGAVDYIPKPFSIRELTSKVELLINN